MKIQIETLPDRRNVSVEMNVDKYRELNLCVGETVCFSPRQARVFVPEYVI